jgi:hypothetical protein
VYKSAANRMRYRKAGGKSGPKTVV